MKNIFEILQEEKNRILEMHESATKNQYLNEQVTNFSPYSQYAKIPDLSNPTAPKSDKVASYTTTKWNQFSHADQPSTNISIGFKPGVKFEATQNPKIVTAKNVDVLNKSTTDSSWKPTKGQKRVSFYCQQGKFFVEGNKTAYVSSQLSAVLVKSVCGKLNYKTTTATSGAKFTQSQDSSFTATNGGVTAGPKKGTTWTWDGKQATAPGINGGVIIFRCNASKFNFNFEYEGMMFKNNGDLKDALVKQFCKTAVKTPSGDKTNPTGTKTQLTDEQKLEKAKNCGHASWEEYKTSNWACNGKQQQPSGNPSSGNQVSALNKQIQQLLGNQSPTGKITDAEIDSILTKLG